MPFDPLIPTFQPDPDADGFIPTEEELEWAGRHVEQYRTQDNRMEHQDPVATARTGQVFPDDFRFGPVGGEKERILRTTGGYRAFVGWIPPKRWGSTFNIRLPILPDPGGDDPLLGPDYDAPFAKGS